MENRKETDKLTGPYVGELRGTQSPHFAAHGPGVYLVCRSKEHAEEVAAALNAAYLVGILSERL